MKLIRFLLAIWQGLFELLKLDELTPQQILGLIFAVAILVGCICYNVGEYVEKIRGEIERFAQMERAVTDLTNKVEKIVNIEEDQTNIDHQLNRQMMELSNIQAERIGILEDQNSRIIIGIKDETNRLSGPLHTASETVESLRIENAGLSNRIKLLADEMNTHVTSMRRLIRGVHAIADQMEHDIHNLEIAIGDLKSPSSELNRQAIQDVQARRSDLSSKVISLKNLEIDTSAPSAPGTGMDDNSGALQ